MMAVCLPVALLAAISSAVTLSWQSASLHLDDRGRIVEFRDVAAARNLVPAAYPFCSLETADGTLTPSSVSRRGDRLTFDFSGPTITYRVELHRGFSLWRVESIGGINPRRITSATWCALPLKGLKTLASHINAYYDDRFAAAVMSTRLNVRAGPAAKQIAGARGVVLTAGSQSEFGILPAGFAIIGCRRRDFEKTIADFEKVAGLPSPHPGGVWSKLSPWTKRSYLFITAFGEHDADLVARWARRGGFRTVLIGGSWSASNGHYRVNRRFFPDGLPSLVRAADKLRAAGLRVGLHFLAAAVSLNDPYVFPKPDPRLVRDAWARLAADIDEKSRFIPTASVPEGFPAEDGGYGGHGTFIQIDDELIRYAALKTAPPFGFAGCIRGAAGTVAASHRKGARIAHLRRAYGYFLYDLDSSLADEVIGNVCRVANAIRADMLYLDGAENLQGPHWYYNAKLVKMYYDRLANKNALVQASSYSHFSWHIISRMASADGHGDVKAYLDRRLKWFSSYAANLMPLDIGWYYIYDPKVTEDQFEYILQKCLGFGASISVQTNPANLRSHPAIATIFDLTRTYERLRLSGKVPASIRAKLRQPGREYRLLRNPLRFRRVTYGPWRQVISLDGKQNRWPLRPAAKSVPLGVQVRCGPLVRPGPSYFSDKALLLEDFHDLAPYLSQRGNRSGVAAITQREAGSASGDVTFTAEIVRAGPSGGPCLKYTAKSARADNSGWTVIGKQFDSPLDLSWHKAIGLWIRGDGKGGLFKLQLRDDKYATDYYIRNNFTDWRYFQLPRPTKPQPGPIDYSRVRYLMLYYNGLPAGQTVTCWIAGIKALPAEDHAEIATPSVELADDRRLSFPVTLREGERLVYFPGEQPYVVPATAGPRRVLSSWHQRPIVITSAADVRFSASSLTGLAEVRLVQYHPEVLPLGPSQHR